MDCPKCHGSMTENTLSTLTGGVTVDKCVDCQGIWFDVGEAERLKDKWMSDHVDDGDPVVGKTNNLIRDIDCPRCGLRMTKLSDPQQKHIQYEACKEHGMYFDAGEFTDYKYETLMDTFRDFIFALRKR
jgi:Zn-finger nucleic acid-binding protein